ncbi:MAG: hypothetical protein ACRDWI_03890 [Jiangellaceae bacterium]
MVDQPADQLISTSRELPPQQQPNGTTDQLSPVTRRGRLVMAVQAGGLDLQTEAGRFELLGPYGLEAHEGDEVEVVGVQAPPPRSRPAAPALLIRQMRRID